MMAAVQGVLLVGGSVCLNYAFMDRIPGLAIVAGVTYAVALSLRVPA